MRLAIDMVRGRRGDRGDDRRTRGLRRSVIAGEVGGEEAERGNGNVLAGVGGLQSRLHRDF